MPSTKPLNIAATSLHKGVSLIEASAGTGKTYALSMLALRFIVEKAITIEEMLIVTFTNLATEELKERIRRQLFAAKQRLENATATVDEPMETWINQLGIDPNLAKQRIRLALLNIDQASIYSIHGFCQKALQEYAMESGQLFDSELITDIREIRQEIADDFWRNQIYLRSSFEVAVLTAQCETPDALLATVKDIEIYAEVYPPMDAIDDALAMVKESYERCRAGVEAMDRKLKEAFLEGTFKQGFVGHWHMVEDWLSNDAIIHPPLQSLSELITSNIENGLNGSKFRNTKSRTCEDRKREYLQLLQLDVEPYDRLYDAIAEALLRFRRALVETLRNETDKRLRQNNVYSFDALINRLSEALRGAQGASLNKALQQTYKVAMIDEFQDTDQNQWHIFSTVFCSPEHYLYLIGDPKQAIYKFRGADIFSYFSAREKVQHHYKLERNWRSHPDLVIAVNTLFTRDKPFLFEQIDFSPAMPALTKNMGQLNQSGKFLKPLVIWQLGQNPEYQTGYWTTGKAGTEIQIAVVNEILQLLNSKTPAAISKNDASRPLKPQDIAILVRTNQQARDYQSILREAGVPSALSSSESVFQTNEACQLLLLLKAVADPGNVNALKQAMTLDWFNLDGQVYFHTINNETALENWFSRFQTYHQLWLQKGFMPMMQNLLAMEGISTQLSRLYMAERRITNLHHLIELTQREAIAQHLSLHKVLDWLRAAIFGQANCEETQLRLESDDEALTIITMHRCKGLEYPVVFCPVLWSTKSRAKYSDPIVKCHENGKLIIDLGSDDFERRRGLAAQEDLAEDLRLLYVAVTRAKYRCYVAWANVRTNSEANASAMAYLLHSTRVDGWREEMREVDFNRQKANLQSLLAKAPRRIEYREIGVPGQVDGMFETGKDHLKLRALERKRQISMSWQMSSYTALSSLSLMDTPEFPLDKAQEQALQVHYNDNPLALPKGAHTGNVIHELMEKVPFRTIGRGEDYSMMLENICQRYGLALDQPNALTELLTNTVNTPLSYKDEAFCLANVNPTHCLKEMPFFMKVSHPTDTARINEILADSPTFTPLRSKHIEGFLTGFIDLVCEYRGRFYLVDYKSNSLPDYHAKTMTQAMRTHNYGLQYWIYSLVLHRYLKQRLADYQYHKHFGGVYYLFVRGMRADQAMSGVFYDYPILEVLQSLEKIIDSRA